MSAAAAFQLLYEQAAHEGDKDWQPLGATAAKAVLATHDWHKFVISPEIPELMVPISYAEQLREHGLFRLPFDRVVVQFGPGGIHHNLKKSLPANARALLEKDEYRADADAYSVALIEQKPETIEGRSFVIGAISSPRDTYVVKSWGRCILPLNREADTSWVSDASSEFYITDDPSLSKDTIGYSEEKANFQVLAFTLVGLINAEGIVQEHHRAPKFINKKREAKGKLPLFEYHVLKISPALKMPGHVAAGGTHASPRLHWRRGHIRKLPSGARTQVRPCLVGDKSLGRIEKDYLVEPPP